MNYNSRIGEFEGIAGGDSDGPGCFTIVAIVFGVIALFSLIMSLIF